MADLDHVVTVRLLAAIDDREWHERDIAKRLRADQDKAVYACLFDAAAAFWLELGLLVDAGRTPSRDQAAAIAYLREPIEQDVLGIKQKYRGAAKTTRTPVTTTGKAS